MTTTGWARRALARLTLTSVLAGAGALAACGDTSPPAPDAWVGPQTASAPWHADLGDDARACGNGRCEPGETLLGCPRDCRPRPSNPDPSVLLDPGFVDPPRR